MTNGDDASQKHRIPVIESMIEVFALLERTPEGATIRQVVQLTGLSRTTVYRMLNTLSAHDFVVRAPGGAYKLGQRLLTLAARVPPQTPGYDLLVVAQPHLERLSDATGQGSKVSVLAGSEILVVAAAQGNQQYSLTTSPGQRLPIHAGAAGKVLLAHLPKGEIEQRLAGRLPALTAKTIVDRKRMLAELARIRQRGWAIDEGEQMSGVHAVAAPIRDDSNAVVAALSVPFVAGVEQSRVDEIHRQVLIAAQVISRDIAHATRAGAATTSEERQFGGAKARTRRPVDAPARPILEFSSEQD